jgi:hypothetical protein
MASLGPSSSQSCGRHPLPRSGPHARLRPLREATRPGALPEYPQPLQRRGPVPSRAAGFIHSRQHRYFWLGHSFGCNRSTPSRRVGLPGVKIIRQGVEGSFAFGRCSMPFSRMHRTKTALVERAAADPLDAGLPGPRLHQPRGNGGGPKGERLLAGVYRVPQLADQHPCLPPLGFGLRRIAPVRYAPLRSGSSIPR